jgi:hypothetical protein
VATRGPDWAVRLVAAALVVLVMLLAQAGAALAFAPYHGAIAGRHDVQTGLAQGEWAHHPPAPCNDHGGAACCMTGDCHSVARRPPVAPSTTPHAVAGPTRYTDAVVPHRDGHRSGPMLPPPRRSV